MVEGLAAFHRGAYEAVELVLPVRVDLGQIDGVRAQRDVVDWTLTEVAARRSARPTAPLPPRGVADEAGIAHSRVVKTPTRSGAGESYGECPKTTEHRAGRNRGQHQPIRLRRPIRSSTTIRGCSTRAISFSCTFRVRVLVESPAETTKKPSAASMPMPTPSPSSSPDSYSNTPPYARLGLGSGTASSRGGRKVKAMATAPRPMPNEPM